MRRLLRAPGSTLRGKIIVPYFIVTLLVAAIGVFVVTRLVAGSLQERLYNQLLDAGRVVAEEQVRFERRRLEVLRAIANTRGVAQAVADGDEATLEQTIPQLVANYDGVESAILLNRQGALIFGWQQQTDAGVGRPLADFDYGALDQVRLVLAGTEDALGDRRVALVSTSQGHAIQTIGALYLGDEIVGAVLVGSALNPLVLELTETAVARVSLYNQNGEVLATTLGTTQRLQALVEQGDGNFAVVPNRFGSKPVSYAGVTGANAAERVPLQELELLGQRYLLAYGDWRLRNESAGLFSVAIPSNFVASAAATSRNLFSFLFSLATVAVFTVGFVVARRLTQPLDRLALVTTAVAAGDLSQRTQIEREDEIGLLARSFDRMAEKLNLNRRALVNERSHLKAIVHSIADGLLVFDQSRRLAMINPAAERFLRDTGLLSGATGGGRTLFAYLREAIGDDVRFQAGSRFFSGSVAPVMGVDAEQLGWVILLRDVTRDVETEQLKDNFITGISHELRTPLTSIKGYSDLLKLTAAPVLSDQQKQFINILQDNANKLMEHVAKLIEMAELHSGTLALHKEVTSLSGMVQVAAEEWAARAGDKGLSFSLDLQDADLWVNGDPERLRWALDNLLRNAYEYTADGAISVRLRREEQMAHLQIADTGMGISASDQLHIFNRFYRAQTEATFDVYGLGLGLFIVREIVNAHGGHVTVQSTLGEGSIFSVMLPALPRPERLAKD